MCHNEENLDNEIETYYSMCTNFLFILVTTRRISITRLKQYECDTLLFPLSVAVSLIGAGGRK